MIAWTLPNSAGTWNSCIITWNNANPMHVLTWLDMQQALTERVLCSLPGEYFYAISLMITSFLFTNIKAWTDKHPCCCKWALYSGNNYSLRKIQPGWRYLEKEQGKAIPRSGSRNQSNTWARSAQRSGQLWFEMFLATEKATSAPVGVQPAAPLPYW